MSYVWKLSDIRRLVYDLKHVTRTDFDEIKTLTETWNSFKNYLNTHEGTNPSASRKSPYNLGYSRAAIFKFINRTLKQFGRECSVTHKIYPDILCMVDPNGYNVSTAYMYDNDHTYRWDDWAEDWGWAEESYWDEEEEDSLILGYDYNVLDELSFMKLSYEKSICETTKLSTPFFGVELEVEADRNTPRDIASKVMDDMYCNELTNQFALLKHDGSLAEDGFEIVTAPATYKVHRIAWKKFFNNSAKELTSWASGRCGIHVHISRDAFSAPHLGKFLVFINDSGNKKFVAKIAGRTSQEWCAFKDKKITDGWRYPFDGERYEAVNLTNSKTIELRIFRGTTKESSFMKNIEFTVASFYFTQTTSYTKLSYDDFLNWLDATEGYPYLKHWLIAKGMSGGRAFRVNSKLAA